MSNHMNENQREQIPPEAVLPNILSGRIIYHLVYIVAKLGVADVLAHGPKSIEHIAKEVDAHPRTLYRALRTLAGQGIFSEKEDQCFELTPPAVYLQTNVPGSVRSWAIMIGEDWFQSSFTNLIHSIRTGKGTFQHVQGMEFFDYLKQDETAAKLFNTVQTNLTEPVLAKVVSGYDFSSFTGITDVGGGKGTMISAILKANPQLKGILYDLPQVIEEARVTIKTENLEGRCSLVPGDMFKEIPQSENIMLKRVIHDWDDQQSIAILKNCRKAIANNGKLLLVEGVVPPGNEPSQVKNDDIAMLAIFGAMERTEAEFALLFKDSGFELTRIYPTPSTMSIIEARPV